MPRRVASATARTVGGGELPSGVEEGAVDIEGDEADRHVSIIEEDGCGIRLGGWPVCRAAGAGGGDCQKVLC